MSFQIDRIQALQKLERIFTHFEDGILILDEKDCILFINPAFRKIFELGKSKLIGQSIEKIAKHPDLNILINLNASDHSKRHEIYLADGRVFNAHFTPIPEVGVGITLQDISYLKALDRKKSELVQTVSHDLRSPLTAILGYIDLLDRIGPLNDNQLDFIERIRTNIQSITELVNTLLDLGQIEVDFDTQKEVTSLEGILHFTIDNLKSQVANKRLNLHLNIPTEIPYLYANPIRLRQMLDNLIGNAIKYTPSGGNVSIQVEVKDEQIILSISDTGIGIPLADQPRIFDEFFRASNVPKDIPGSGLGLAIVKAILDNHSGRIWVDSTPEKGSIFVVVLPAHLPETVQSP